MSWLSDIIKGVVETESVAFVTAQDLPVCEAGQVRPFDAKPLAPDGCYVELYVGSMWLPKSRWLTSGYYAVGHVYSTLSRQGEADGQIAFVTTPPELAKADPDSLAKVVTSSVRALGPVPWRGGNLGLEVGLFSVKAYDLTSSFLDMVTSISDTAGVSFLSAATPYVPLVKKGLELLTGTRGSAALEVGMVKGIQELRTGYWGLVATDKRELDRSRLSVDVSDRTLLYDGQQLTKYPWIVLSIRSTTQRPDFGQIPELKSAWATFMDTIKKGKRDAATEALTVLRLTTLTSPDLITADATALYRKGQAYMAAAFDANNMNAVAANADLPLPEELSIYPN